MTQDTPLPVGLRALADAAPDRPAVTDGRGTISRRELDQQSTQLARAFAERGVKQGDYVSICLPSNRDFLISTVAAWKIGATPVPMNARLAADELTAIIELTKPGIVVGIELPADSAFASMPDIGVSESHSDEPLPPVVSPSFKAPTSGGSSGRPKVVVSTSPAVLEPLVAFAERFRIRPEDTFLTPAPLYHNGPFLFSCLSLITGGHVVLMERFDPLRTLELLDEHRVGYTYSVPTIMTRIAKLDPEVTGTFDLTGLHTLMHMAAPCPPWVKRWWLDRIGPANVWELYAGTEAQAGTLISGTEWLEHPSSVGTVALGEVAIFDTEGNPLPAGEVGEVFMRPPGGVPTYRYLGAVAKSRDGWESLGDIGRFDADGYLYIADRLDDMVLVGGVNVYPAEIESVLDSHPLVVSSCVIGLPDDEMGNRLHAVVECGDPGAEGEIRELLAARLAPFKRPRTIEFVETPLRNDAGKIRRSLIRKERLTSHQS